MLRRTFVKFAGAVAAMLGLPGGVRDPEPRTCPRCEGRHEGLRPGQISRAETEDELWDELECWWAGHFDAHDRAVLEARRRVLERARGGGDPRAARLLGRRETAT